MAQITFRRVWRSFFYKFLTRNQVITDFLAGIAANSYIFLSFLTIIVQDPFYIIDKSILANTFYQNAPKNLFLQGEDVRRLLGRCLLLFDIFTNNVNRSTATAAGKIAGGPEIAVPEELADIFRMVTLD
jgi:hypothetical protein